ncbi:MAG TPA: YciI family protein [Anaeromyxobacteraceae bacterium]|nr:YciI family protein [Anaeromyxobacteraceae bacterium]
MRIAAAVAVLLAAAAARAGNPEAKPEPPKPPFEMESFQLVLLRRGPHWTPEVTPAVEALQKRHIGHLEAMHQAGKMVIAGPLGDQPDPTLRGVCLYRVGSVDEARALAEQDPAVQAGRLKVEAMTWWVGKGHLAFPKAPAPR